MQPVVSQYIGGNIFFKSSKESVTKISSGKLREIRSKVRTHEGELLTGKKGRAYLDKYSRQYLGKDLSHSYMDDKVRGKVRK